MLVPMWWLCPQGAKRKRAFGWHTGQCQESHSTRYGCLVNSPRASDSFVFHNLKKEMRGAAPRPSLWASCSAQWKSQQRGASLHKAGDIRAQPDEGPTPGKQVSATSGDGLGGSLRGRLSASGQLERKQRGPGQAVQLLRVSS